MINDTFVDEHGNVYQAPYIPKIILGFQGIDPSSLGPELAIKEWWEDYKKFMHNKDTEDDSSEDDEIIPISHDKLEGLTGGDTNGYYHLTQAEYEVLADFVDEYKKGKYDYLLTEDDYTKLTKIFNALRNDIDEQGIAFLTEEEYTKLDKLFGVMFSEDSIEPVFLSEKEYEQLSAVLKVLYPDEDSTEPVFPSISQNVSIIDGGEVIP